MVRLFNSEFAIRNPELLLRQRRSNKKASRLERPSITNPYNFSVGDANAHGLLAWGADGAFVTGWM
jgi:hypothetical protein